MGASIDYLEENQLLINSKKDCEVESCTDYCGEIVYLTYEDIKLGQKAEIKTNVTDELIEKFAEVSGDINPVHLSEDFASKTIFKKRIAHGMLGAALISAVLGTKLPGPNTIYISQNLRFLAPIYIGDIVTASVEVSEKLDEKKKLYLITKVVNQKGEDVIIGEAFVMKDD
ncbi:(R)-specific enoyl-CoA hydratase [Clostridium acetireducens DSM 10703]|uniref:(R)-specific enoyl-CoA hydratase n=1 Tax=Clostridium acetireducens DSM 10703 TaxID=1121290 RepID=A0A1E8EW59_9CLOT|nr:MaoC family dehydratase [Clostridium acetireducens]OFI01501.1 (R)-specific enoyl-CoA hydratase [Clostridium acetireducens DSM 10703]